MSSDNSIEAENRPDRIALEPLVYVFASQAGKSSMQSRWPSGPSERRRFLTLAVSRTVPRFGGEPLSRRQTGRGLGARHIGQAPLN